MRAMFTLIPSESKRLIAKGVQALPAVQKALRDHTIVINTGTTNAYLAEALWGEPIVPKTRYTVGMFGDGMGRESDEEGRIPAVVITKGVVRPRDFFWDSYVPDAVPGDIFIKGANAVDHNGLAAVAAANPKGGTIGIIWGIVMQRGLGLIVPVGLEKLVPDVRKAVELTAERPTDISIGLKISLMPLLGAKVVTEITALETLFPVKATCVAAGGVAGSEGAVTLIIEGEEAAVKQAVDLINAIKEADKK